MTGEARRRLTVVEAWAEMERTGLSGACVIEEHAFCHPQDVYVQLPGQPPYGPVSSITCTCTCHEAAPTR